MCGGAIHNTAHLNGISRSCAMKWPCSGPKTWVWNLQYRVGNYYRSLRNNGMLKGLRAQWERLSEDGLKHTTFYRFSCKHQGELLKLSENGNGMIPATAPVQTSLSLTEHRWGFPSWTPCFHPGPFLPILIFILATGVIVLIYKPDHMASLLKKLFQILCSHQK